jgi:poly(3-hydroxybutyrate) depolymerase
MRPSETTTRGLAFFALLVGLPACFRDPDVNKMKCTPAKGCPDGYQCVSSSGTYRCQATSSLGVDGPVSPAGDGPLAPPPYDGAPIDTTADRLDTAGTREAAANPVDGRGPDSADVPMTDAEPPATGTGGGPGAGGAGGSGPTGSGGATTGAGGLGSTGGISGMGGATGRDAGTAGAPGTGGAGRNGGSPLGGTGAGGLVGSGGRTGTGGSPGTGGAGTGGTGAPGTGGAGTGGAPGTGGSGTGGATIPCTLGSNCPPGNTPIPSAGCGTQGNETLLAAGTAVASGLATSRRLTITSGGSQREYIIDIPSTYDNTHPYRLFFAFHWMSGSDTAVATGTFSSMTNAGAENWGFFGLHRTATAANQPAIFIAPQGGNWQLSDQTFFDDLLALAKAQLCIDTTRVFATGFNFGAMLTYTLSLNHQKDLRAAVGIAPENYNIALPTNTHERIAWMQTTGMSDSTCPWVSGTSTTLGAKYCAIGRAEDNGCTAPTSITMSTGNTHYCHAFQGCQNGYPVKVCTFDGGHSPAPIDGSSTPDGLNSWIPTESWIFFAQF